MNHLGIAIGGGWIRAAVWRRKRVVWAAEHPCKDAGQIAEVLSSLVTERPARLTAARVVLTGELCQVRLLPALGRVRGSRLARAAALNRRRWFVGSGEVSVTSAWSARRGGSAIAISAAAATLDAIWHGCGAAGLRVGSVTSLALVMAVARGSGSVAWREDDVAVEAEAERGRLISIRRRLALGEVDSTVVGLEAMSGEVGGQLVPAAIAARWSAPVSLAPPAGESLRALRRRTLSRRLVATGVSMWVAAATVLGLRVAAVERRARSAEQRLRADAVLATARTTVAAFDGLMDALATAQAVRSNDLRLVSRLQEALPESAALFGLERNGGTVLLRGVAPAAAVVPAALLEAGFQNVRLEAQPASAGFSDTRERFVVRLEVHQP